MNHSLITTALVLATGTGLVAPTGVRAQNPTRQYLTQRKASGFVPGLALADISREPARYAGRVVELDGRLTGIARAEDGDAIVCLSSPTDGTLTLRMSSVPTWLQPGAIIRALCVVIAPEAGHVVVGIPEMAVIAVANAADLADVEARQAEILRAKQIVEAQKRADAERRARISAAPNAGNVRPGRPTFEPGINPANGYRNPNALASRGATIARAPTGSPIPGPLSPAASGVFPYYKAFIAKHNKRLDDTQANQITYAILRYSEELDMDPRLIVATIIAESDFRVAEKSHAGAMGLIQLMPDEVQRLKLTNPYDPIQNVAGGIYLLKERLNKYSGSGSFKDARMEHIILALASYNAGMGAVKKYGGVPPYRETRGYVKRIEKLYRELCAGD